MDRAQIAQEMVEKFRGNNQIFMTEVAMPGARPDTVKDHDIDQYRDERKD